MARDWKIGEVVWLKSGGPAMTVAEATKTDGSTPCRWFAPEQTGDRLHYPTASFHKDCLTGEEPHANQIARLDRQMSTVDTKGRVLESIKVEPVTVNWQGGLAPSVEMIEQIVAQVRKTLAQEMADATSLVSGAFTQEGREKIERLVKETKAQAKEQPELRDSTEDAANKKLRGEMWEKAGGPPSKQEPIAQQSKPASDQGRRNAKPLT